MMGINATPIAGFGKRQVRPNSKTPEAKTVAAVRRWIQDKPDVYTVRVVQAGENGVADFIMCIRGKFVAVECKATGEIPRRIQMRHGERAQCAGGIFIYGDAATLIPELEKIYTSID